MAADLVGGLKVLLYRTVF